MEPIQYNGNGEPQPSTIKKQEVDIKFVFAKVLGNWHWYAISLAAFIVLGILVELFFPPHYNITAKVLVNGDNSKVSSGMPSETDLLSDLGMFSVESNVNNELQVLHSRTLIKQTIYDLQLNVTYSQKDGLFYKEVYKQSPFLIKLVNLNYKLETDPIEYDVAIHKNKVQFTDEDSDSTFTASFGDTLHFNYGTWVLLKNNYSPLASASDVESLRLEIASYGKIFDDYFDGIVAMVTSTDVTTIDLTFTSTIPQKGEETLKHLIDLYVESNINDKNKIADSTIAFIDSRLVRVTDDLNKIESNIEQFKKQNNLADLSEQGKALIGTSIETAKALADQEVQISVVRDLIEYLQDTKNNQRIMPTTAPIQDPAFVSLLEKYNTFQLQRQQLLLNSTELNPAVKSIDVQLVQLREDLLKMLRSYEQGLMVSKTDLEKRNTSMEGAIKEVPTQEKVYLEYSRVQQVLQGLYMYLLQTREQTAISKSNNIAPIRIVDAPESDYEPYFPNMLIILIAAFVLGILVPSLVLFFKHILNTKVLSVEDIAAHTSVPVVAEISHSKLKRNIVVTEDSRSAVAEQFRILRTNLQYLLTHSGENTIMVTSSMSGEGKTFVVVNLAMALALSGKKVLMIELDLRKPKLSNVLGLENNFGLSNYIVEETVLPEQIIKPSGLHENIFIVGSGYVPPNPSELIMHERMDLFFNSIKNKFDYILIDTPPVGLVTDAQLISRFVNTTLYLVRQRVTYKKQLEIVETLYVNRILKRINIVLNDTKQLPGYSYGYGYSYGNDYYGKAKKPFFKRIFSYKKV